MAKKALLIGVSEYKHGLNPLPSAVKDVEAMQRILANPEMGGFAEADIKVLKNPQPDEIAYAIYHLFADRQKDDLLLFYFSGHGIKDDRGKLYLSSCGTKKQNGKLVTPSAVAASVLHDNMNDSRSQRQVIILDCCFSGAIAQGMTVKDDNSVNVQEQLGGKGRAILTSSTSMQYSFEQEGSELSIYTRYLVEGIEKGAADKDGDGWISVDELHEYASSKVQEASPAMTPEFYPVKDGSKILLAKSPKDDPKVKYRKEFNNIALEDEGEISLGNRFYLNEVRNNLGLSDEDVNAIEFEVLEPYRQRQEKLQRYQQALSQIIQQQFPISENNRNGLQRLQIFLNLRDEDIASIKQRVLAPKQAEYERQQQEAETLRQEQQTDKYENKLQRYEQELLNAVQAGYPLDEFVRDGLKNFQQFLGLGDEDIASIKQQVLAPRQAVYEREQQKRYEQELLNAVQAGYPLDEFVRDRLKNFQQFLGLGDEDIASIEQQVLAPRQAAYEREQQKLKRLNQQQDRRRVRGDDLRLDLKLDFQEAIFGGEKEIRISHIETCEVCKGSGAKSGTRSRACATCNGSGQVRNAIRTPFGTFNRDLTCSICKGIGLVIEDDCDACDGKGRDQVIKTLKMKITIPAGVDNGTRLRIANEGDAGQYGEPYGDLYIYLFVNEDGEFQRDGINILSNIKISQLQATSGCRLQVNTIDGLVELSIPPGTQPNAVMKLKNRGVPRLGNPISRGDHLITVQIVT